MIPLMFFDLGGLDYYSTNRQEGESDFLCNFRRQLSRNEMLIHDRLLYKHHGKPYEWVSLLSIEIRHAFVEQNECNSDLYNGY